MNNASVRLSKPIDPARVETLAKVAAIAAETNVEFVLVGAFARDIHFDHVWGIHSRRKTADMDLAVQVRDWPHFEQLRSGLQTSAFFSPVPERKERFLSANRVFLDIIPFGGVAQDGEVIFWPPDNDRMSVTGVADAFEHALVLELPENPAPNRVRLTSIPGLVILKIIAIYDRIEERVKKDSNDIEFIMTNYLDAGNRARLASGPDSDIAQGGVLDIEIASARLLGRDMARMSSLVTRQRITALLDREAWSAGNCPVTQELRGLLPSARGDFRRARQVVAALLAGYNEP